MLEDSSRMDKKLINRTSQVQSRPSATDCKKSGGELANKSCPRFNKKRESNGTTPKNDGCRKNIPPARGRGAADRRPRSRGFAAGGVGGAEGSRLDEDEPELGSVFVPGSKKQNLNHLLNFVYSPRGATDRNRAPTRRGSYGRSYESYRPHDNALYLQANCQFIVKEGGDYSIHLLDPDVPIKWEQIEEIIVRDSGKADCPICLGSAVAARVGRCGHALCWPCALHYARSREHAAPPCPVCAAPLPVHAMRPARHLVWQPNAQQVTMRLVRRLRGSTVVEEAPARDSAAGAAPPAIRPVADLARAPYAKFFSATMQQVREIIERERQELKEQILLEIDTTEIVYFEEALEMLAKKEEELSTGVAVTPVVEEDEEAQVPTVVEKQEMAASKVDWFDVDENDEACSRSEYPTESSDDIASDMENLAIADMNLNPDAEPFEFKPKHGGEDVEIPLIEECGTDEEFVSELTDVDKENQAKYFYFYQGADGQQVFLHGLNARVLTASWGCLAAAPPVLTATLLRRDAFSVTEQTRKHMPCAAHLPLHCPFEVVELDLRPPAVSQRALDTFAEELSRRAKIRARLEREERRREMRARRALEGPPRPDIASQYHFPPASPPAPAPPPPPTAPTGAASDGSGLPLAASPPDPSPPPALTSPSGLSFAKMARAGGAWRVREAPLPAVGSASAPAAVEGAADDETPAAPRALSLSDAIAAALHAPTRHKQPKKKKKQRQGSIGAQDMD